jgi:hypothetical protein
MTRSTRVHHSADFLQTFHTGRTTAQRREAAGQIGSEAPVEAADPAAIAFVRTGRPAATFAQPARDDSYTAEISGWTVRQGNGFLTEKQAKFVIAIAQTREGVTDAMRAALAVRLDQGFAKIAASQFITTYKDLPIAKAPAPAAKTVTETEVPAGRYAIASEDGVKFYKLDRPTEGKWAGYTFLKVQASDELYPIRNRDEKARIIAEIAKDVEGSAAAYGQLLGKCYKCGRTLTDETSRNLGIGPDCRSK